jgi:hypothetical protein
MKSEMTSLTLWGCDGSLHIYSRVAILEWSTVSDIEVIPKWPETIMRGYSSGWEIYSNMAGDNERLFKWVGNCIRLLKRRRAWRGGVTEDTYSKRYVLLWSALGCALQLEEINPIWKIEKDWERQRVDLCWIRMSRKFGLHDHLMNRERLAIICW